MDDWCGINPHLHSCKAVQSDRFDCSSQYRWLELNLSVPITWLRFKSSIAEMSSRIGYNWFWRGCSFISCLQLEFFAMKFKKDTLINWKTKVKCKLVPSTTCQLSTHAMTHLALPSVLSWKARTKLWTKLYKSWMKTKIIWKIYLFSEYFCT